MTMRFFSDNAAPVCDAVMAALAKANHADDAYDGDALSTGLNHLFSELFEKEVEALWVTTGTAANALALAAICPSHNAIVCHRDAHIQNDECGAPEFFTAGAKLLLAEGEGAKLSPATVNALLDATRTDVHMTQPAALSITQASEYGCVYTADEVAALGALCRERGLRFHMDGARFANAVVHLGCRPADISWRAGVDVLSFGFVKNGGLSAEALIFFDPALAVATRYRRKRSGHLMSKGRYQAAQLVAMVEDDLWLKNAAAANDGAARLGQAAASRLLHPVEANEVFLRLSAAEAKALRDQGFLFHDWGIGEARFVVSWNQPEAEIAALAEAFTRL